MSPKKATKKFKSTPKKSRSKKGEKRAFNSSLKLRYAEECIKRTLAYRAPFNYPLSFYQLSTFLISEKSVDSRALETSIKNLRKRRRVFSKFNKYYLNGTRAVNWNLREKKSKEALKVAESTAQMLSAIPWVKMICVTGSVAAWNKRENEDIDIFIVTQKKRLWLTRGFLFLLLKVSGMLTRPKNEKNKICPNILVSESSMKWPKNAQNVYVANEILMMHPVLDRDDTYFKFLEQNSWIKGYFANFEFHSVSTSEKSAKKEKKSEVVDFMEKTAEKLQIKYMKNKKTTEKVSKNIIHFNKKDSTPKVLEGYYQALEKLNVPVVEA